MSTGRPKKVVKGSASFFGGGINATSWLVPVGTSRIPYRPYGATWPFARLKISKSSAKFSIAALFIYKTAKPSNAKVSLGKSGYFYFHTPNNANDFGFTTPRIDAVIRELRKCGYHLDESCERNLMFAKISLFSQVALAIVFGVIIVTGFLKSST